MINNLIIGNPICTDAELGIEPLPVETTVRFTREEVTNEKGEIFLPAVLKMAGIVKSTSQVRQIQKQRDGSPKFKGKPDQNLWRKLEGLEFTEFKIGKHVFWLVVGE